MAESAGNNVVSLEDRKSKAQKWGKKDILAGVGKVEQEYFERVDAVIPLRRLTVGEWEQIEEIQSGGVTLSGTPPQQNRDGGPRANNMNNMKMDINISESVRSERLAKIMACSYCLSVEGDVWTVEDVRSIENPGLVDDIAARVFSISGVRSDAQEAIQNFREEQRGGDASVSDSAGDASGESSESTDSGTVPVSDDSDASSGDA